MIFCCCVCKKRRGGESAVEYSQRYDRFQLKPGQWTDDTSMALCLADSLLYRNGYDGTDLRTRFHCWWFRGYNNAFSYDESRSGSVGLGGNIAKSLMVLRPNTPVPPVVPETSEDSGNGSIMRLAPVPIFYHWNIQRGCEVAGMQSLATHPGPQAKAACEFMSYLIARAISWEGPMNARRFLEEVVSDYESLIQSKADERGADVILRLIRCKEPQGGPEMNWNWRSKSLNIAQIFNVRGSTYNGYPVSSGYFGSYCIDGLAMALHSIYHTTNFDDAVLKCVNMRGDADTTGAICGQIAGAMYGYSRISDAMKRPIEQWDHLSIPLRAILLYRRGELLAEGDTGNADKDGTTHDLEVEQQVLDNSHQPHGETTVTQTDQHASDEAQVLGSTAKLVVEDSTDQTNVE
eukprot:c12242_g1_i2.p1 GENE.c12242_g1_i2~~c12242_g1_i2.p1  ORF type:complete len:405 (+),score=66.64 c12242_g1_i2:85-1299(+)